MSDVTNILTQRWWPICKKCNKIVDNLLIEEKRSSVVKSYTVYCHGKKEKHLIGVWAAFDYQQQQRRLPDVFV